MSNFHNDDDQSPDQNKHDLDTNEGLASVPDDTVLVNMAVPPPGLKPGDIPDEVLVMVSLKNPTFGQVKELLTAALETGAEDLAAITADLNNGHTVRALHRLHHLVELILDWTGPVMGGLHNYEHTYDERSQTMNVDFSDLDDSSLADLMKDLPPLPSQSAGR